MSFVYGNLAVADLKTDGTQMRCDEDNIGDTVSRYAETLRQWQEENADNPFASSDWPFPPIDVFWDAENECHWVGDGHQRLGAYRRVGVKEIKCCIHDPADMPGKPNGHRAAILYAVQCNENHGVNRSNAAKRKAVTTMLTDKEWVQWSDRQIATHCKVSPRFVGIVRKELEGDGDIEVHDTRTAMRGDGTQYSHAVKDGPADLSVNGSHLGHESGKDGQDATGETPKDEDNSGDSTEANEEGAQDHDGKEDLSAVPSTTISTPAPEHKHEARMEQYNEALVHLKKVINTDLKKIDSMAGTLTAAQFPPSRLAAIKTDAKNLINNLNMQIGVELCTACSGEGRNCNRCLGLGWLSAPRLKELKHSEV